jgi:RHS repeat-associated protein
VLDAFGRTTSAQTSAGSARFGFFVIVMVAADTIGAGSHCWTLDPAMRLRTSAAGGVTNTNHYENSSDSPAWIDEGGSITRMVDGITGDLAATTTPSGGIAVQLATLHGDVAQQIALSDPNTIDPNTATVFLASDEYGNPAAGSGTARYGWLGAKERSTDTVGAALTLMGVRLYNPATGRFLSSDPIPGGNATAYDYCSADPINCYDLDGRWGFHMHLSTFVKVVGFAAAGTCALATAGICGVAAGVAFSVSAGYRGVEFARNGRYNSGSEWGRFGAGLLGDTFAWRLPGVRGVEGTRLARHGVGIGRHAARPINQSLSSAYGSLGGWGRLGGQAAAAAWAGWGP